LRALGVADAEIRILRFAGFDQRRIDRGQRLAGALSLRRALHDRADAVDHDPVALARTIGDEAGRLTGLPDRGAGSWRLLRGRRSQYRCGDR
jgi:hypothetical protein